MTRAITLALALAACGLPDLPVDHPTYDLARAATVQRGMTKDQVVATLGRPQYMIHQSPAGGIVEVWSWRNTAEGVSDVQLFRVGLDAAGVVVRSETVQPRRRSR
jgi:hypothetical protein